MNILDREDNFISLKKDGRTEYLKQATRTSADNYISPLIMENKQVTKIILSEHGVHVPEGQMYSESEAAVKDFDHYSKPGSKQVYEDLYSNPDGTSFVKSSFPWDFRRDA